MRDSPAFEVNVWHNLFLFEIDGKFGNTPVFVGIVVLPLVRCIRGSFLVGMTLHRGVLLLPQLSDAAESEKAWLDFQGHCKFVH